MNHWKNASKSLFIIIIFLIGFISIPVQELPELNQSGLGDITTIDTSQEIEIEQKTNNDPPLTKPRGNHKTRARYLDDRINLDDPEVQLTVISGDAYDSWYANYYGCEPITSGDIDNDGIDDLIMGSPYADGAAENLGSAGQVMVVYGRNQTHPGTVFDQAKKNNNEINLVIHGGRAGNLVGFSLACGDIDGDDFDDIIIGAPGGDGKNNGRTNSGEIYVIYGTHRYNLGNEINLQNSAPDITIYGAVAGDLCGYKSLTVGDVIGDNREDIIIGSIRADPLSRTDAGSAFLVAGDTRGSLGSEIDLRTNADVVIMGANISDLASSSLVTGDVNGDSRDDIVIGAFLANPYGIRTDAGAAYVIYGKQTLPSTIDLNDSADVIIYGTNNWDYLGYSLAMGNINGDQYDDIVISSYGGDGFNNALGASGEVYIVYGSSNLLSIIDTNTNGHDVIIFGENFQDIFGFSVATGNANNDQFDDILVSAMWGDGDQNSKNLCGETYLFLGNTTGNLGNSLDPLTDSKSVFYGADIDDRSGRYLHMGDFDGDDNDDIVIFAAYADGPDNARDAAGEFYLVYSHPPPVKNEFVRLIDGDIDNKTIFSQYRAYTLKVNVSNILGYKDFKWVTLTIDPTGYNISFRWTQIGLKFSELNKTNNLIECISTEADSVHDGLYNFSLDFKLIFNWSFMKNEMIDCQITSNCLKSIKRTDYIEDVFKVNNKLNFIGKIVAKGEFQGDLIEHDWVKGGEEITFSGLTVVYDNTTDYFPPKSEYSIGIESINGLTEFIPIVNGEELNEEVNVPEQTGGYKYDFKILGIPEYSDLSDLYFNLKIDNDLPVPPDGVICKADSLTDLEVEVDDDRNFHVIWTETYDPDSGILGYYYSLEDQGGTENGFWTQETSTEIVNATEGLNTVYVWARDAVGNIGPVNSGQIFIDLSEVSFFNFKPANRDWFTTKNITCTIQIEDPDGFGVDPNNIGYWDGITNKWIKAPDISTNRSTIYNISILAYMNEGTENYVQFRASDLAGNGPTYSQQYYFKIDTIPVTFSGVTPNPIIKQNSPIVKCYITIEDLGGSGVNLSSIQYSYTTNGLGNFSEWTNNKLAMISNLPNPGESSRWIIELDFNRGDVNYIRWRAKDIAGNGYTESPTYQILVNALPVISIKQPDPSIDYTSESKIELNGEDTYDPDDALYDSSFTWSSNITGVIGSGRILNTKLSPGFHHITLTVFDGQSNTSSGFNISVAKPNKPSSTDSGVTGLDRSTESLFLFLIIIVIIICALFFVAFTRERKRRRVLEKRALGLDTTYLPAGASGLRPGATTSPQMYDGFGRPTEMTSIGTLDQLPTTVSPTPYGTNGSVPPRMEQLPSVGGTMPYQPSAQTPTPTPTPAAAPGTAPTPSPATTPGPRPQLPPAILQAGPSQQAPLQTQDTGTGQPQLYGQPEPEINTQGQPEPTPATQPVFHDALPIDDLTSTPDETILPEEIALPEEEPEILQPLETDTTPPPMESPEPKPSPEPLHPLVPEDDKKDDKSETEIPLGLTPDSPEFVKRIKKDDKKN
jgi:hypothetical protein